MLDGCFEEEHSTTWEPQHWKTWLP